MPNSTDDDALQFAKLFAVNPAEAFLTSAKSFSELQHNCLNQMARFWQSALSVASPAEVPAASRPADDKRFGSEAWRSLPGFDVMTRSYLDYCGVLLGSIEAVPVDEKAKGQIRFVLRQLTDAISPSNVFATNPEAMQLALETGGQSVADGINLFLQDLAKGRISMSDETAFEVGRNLAVTPGAVIFENDLIQVIQYAPSTARVCAIPLVIIPPAINKFYILDLQPQNSLVRYTVEQGHTVFLVSWRNVTPELGHLSWDDYLDYGVIRAIEVALAVSGAERVSTLDFSDTGEIGLLITEQSMVAREAAIGRSGLLQGKELALVFSSLRANDLIWPYVVNSYLKGKAPPAFDMLYWNSDSTNLPGPMFCWYVRNTYLENNFKQPLKTIQCDLPLDFSSVTVPAYLYASRDDHIVPWRSAYVSTRVLGGETTFVLGASGHIAGVINAPANQKRNFWSNGTAGADAENWLSSASSVPGSWWPHWAEWLKSWGGLEVVARETLGNDQCQPIEPAPGRYVRQSAL